MENIIINNIEEKRIDIYLSNIYKDISRTKINQFIKDGSILVNNKKIKPSYLLQEGDNIFIKSFDEEKIILEPVNLPLDIIYEDECLIVLNKPKGLVVHPGVDKNSNTLVNRLLYHTDKLSDIDGEERPGIVHRLDKDTSGLLVIAKDNNSHLKIKEQLLNRTMKREYLLLVNGIVTKDNGKIHMPIGRDPKNRLKMTVINENSKEAITYYEVIKRYENYSYLKASLYTGRMHQIRVHMSHIGYPIVGDSIYGYPTNEFSLKNQLLHSYKIGFIHPQTNKYVEFINHDSIELNEVLEKLDKMEVDDNR